MAAAAIASGAMSLLGSVGNIISQQITNKRNIRFQREENQKNRDFNHTEAQLAYDRSIQQWDRENKYNSPAAIMQRLRDAGLNPNLAYGDVSGLLNSAGVMPAASSSGSVSPTSAPLVDGASIANSISQANLNEALARKADADADVQYSYSKFSDQINAGLVELQNVQISVGSSVRDLNDAQKHKLYSEVVKINTEVEHLKESINQVIASTENLKEDFIYKKIQNVFSSEMFSNQVKLLVSQINKNIADTNLSYSQANDILMTQTARILLMQAQADSSLANALQSFFSSRKLDLESKNLDIIGQNLYYENGILQADFNDAQSYRKMTKAPVLGEFIRGIHHCINLFK